MKMTTHLGVIMDPIQSIKPHKDSSFAILLAAQQKGWLIWYMELNDLFWSGNAQARMTKLKLFDQPVHWFEFQSEPQIRSLNQLDIILMRKDPPFNMEYIYATYLLEQAEAQGCLVVNRPQSLRDWNEKMAALWFPECIPPSLVSRRYQDFKDFLNQYGEIIIKPLDGMGGTSIFKISRNDPNTQVILETLTERQKRFALAQKFIPEVQQGDKRILIIDGQAVPYALARIPPEGEIRANLAVGGQAQGVALSPRDQFIVNQIAPVLQKKGIFFAGIDVIGDYLTEINITSPTCIRELDALYDLNIGRQLLDCLEKK